MAKKRSTTEKIYPEERNSIERTQETNDESFGLECGSVCIGDVYTLRNDDVTKLEACKMWIWRKMDHGEQQLVRSHNK